MSVKRRSLLARIEILKRRSLAELYQFDKYVLGYKLMVPHVHDKLCRFVMKRAERGEMEQSTKMILMPRNSFKSTAITVGYSLWRLCNNPNLTILITNEKLDKSKAFLKEIKAHMTNNPRFKLMFGEWSCENKIGKKWSETRIDIMPRRVWSAAPSIEVSSVESSETGKHVDLIICDDLHGQSNTTTKEQIDKVIEYWRDLGAVLKPGGEMIIIGTRWDYKDLYQFIYDLKKELGDLANIEIMHEKAEREDGTLLFPEVLSKPFLARQRASLGSYFFGAQYQNEPIQRESALIKQVPKYGDTINGQGADSFFSHCKHFLTVDLAYTEDKRSDSTAILCNAVNPLDGRWYIRRYDVLKTGDPGKIIELLFEYNKIFKPIRIGIEKNNYISWLKKPLEDAMRSRGIFLPIDPPDGLPHYGQGKNKALRLRNIAPRFNYGECFIHESMSALEDELLKLTFDGARGHDDLLDALSMQYEIVLWGITTPENKYDNEEAGNVELAVGSDINIVDDRDWDLNSKAWLYA